MTFARPRIDAVSSSFAGPDPGLIASTAVLIILLRNEPEGDGVLPPIRDDALLCGSSDMIDLRSSSGFRSGPPKRGIQRSEGTCNLPDTFSGKSATTLAGLISNSMNASIAAL